MGSSRKIPWMVELLRAGTPNDNWLLFYVVTFSLAATLFFIFMDYGGSRFIVYGSTLMTAALLYLGAWLWLKKNNELEK